ncbi:hypothetical protein [Aliterella atlantica]|uniref:Uncharacterized protein n=1 Tax=Aliterella atlantica CENA595 TaxID=1618023 RepID=A0A0D8ZMR7_9CYAN|nr:hypothetical protein [Aliterella atlantica]KJH69642.1 hypothetical protein UH38_22695 [Aliterella atlantica CENA595]
MNQPEPNNKVSRDHLQLLLDPYDSLQHLECDGLTQVFHSVYGVFYKDSEKRVSYLGKPVDLPLLPLPIVQILVQPFDSDISITGRSRSGIAYVRSL